jgi:hypothetical protein
MFDLNKKLFTILTVFIATYSIMFIVVFLIVDVLNAGFSGLFRWIILASTVILSGSFYRRIFYKPPSNNEKTFIVFLFSIVSIIIDYFLSAFFKTSNLNIVMWVFYFIIITFYFNKIVMVRR